MAKSATMTYRPGSCRSARTRPPMYPMMSAFACWMSHASASSSSLARSLHRTVIVCVNLLSTVCLPSHAPTHPEPPGTAGPLRSRSPVHRGRSALVTTQNGMYEGVGFVKRCCRVFCSFVRCEGAAGCCAGLASVRVGCGPRVAVFPSVRSLRRDECGWQARLPRHVFAVCSHDGIDGHGHVGLNQFDDSQQAAGFMPFVELATGPCPSLTRPPFRVRGSGSRRHVIRSRPA